MVDQSTSAPDRSRPRRARSRASLPLLAGSLIAAAGLIFGGIATASAHGQDHGRPSGHGPHPAPTSTHTPRHGDAIPNVTLVENEIKAYYGSVAGTVGTDSRSVTLPDPAANYAKEVKRIEARAKAHFAKAIKKYKAKHSHATKHPALVFDVDDTTLNTYDYEIFSNFAYNPSTNADFVNNADFPAVFGMPSLVNWAAGKGYTVFFLTGRPEAQRAGTVTNLDRVGYTVATDASHLYLKQATPPSYLHCADPAKCTTIEYKSGTRAHIASLGYRILGDFGDQYSDLKGGTAGHRVKLPNPMYYLP